MSIRDFHEDERLARFKTAPTGAFRALARLREQGAIKGWRLGVKKSNPASLLLDPFRMGRLIPEVLSAGQHA